MKKRENKLLASLLAVVLILGLAPVPLAAESGFAEVGPAQVEVGGTNIEDAGQPEDRAGEDTAGAIEDAAEQQDRAGEDIDGAFEVSGTRYQTLTAAVEAIGDGTGTVYVTGDASITDAEEFILIEENADITIMSPEGMNPAVVTKETERFAFKLLGGKLTFKNIIFDGNAEWEGAEDYWYERTATGMSSAHSFIYDMPQTDGSGGGGSTLVFGMGATLRNFYVDREAAGLTKEPLLGGSSCLPELSLLALEDTTVTINDAALTDNGMKSDVKSLRGENDIVAGLIYAVDANIAMESGLLTRNWIIPDNDDNYYKNLSAGASGGHIYLENGSFIMNGGAMEYGCARDGGAIAGQNAKITINGGSVGNSVAVEHGGGIALWGDEAEFTMSGGEISFNTAEGQSLWDNEEYKYIDYTGKGGGIYLEGEKNAPLKMQITGGLVHSNRAPHGGGLYLEYTSGTMSDITVSSCYASGTVSSDDKEEFGWEYRGAGMRILESDIEIKDAKIRDNESSSNSSMGAGIDVQNANVKISGKTNISGNDSDGNGVLAALSGANVIITGETEIKDNAWYYGRSSAIWLYGGADKNGVSEDVTVVITGNATCSNFYGDVSIQTAETGRVPNLYLDGRNTTVPKISLDGKVSALYPSVKLIAPFPEGKTVSVECGSPDDEIRGRALVEPGSYEIDGVTLALTDVEPYIGGFSNISKNIVPGRSVEPSLAGKLVYSAPPATYTITFSHTEGLWSISPSAGEHSVRYGRTLVFSYNTSSGYRLADVLVDGVSQSNPGNSYKFENVTADHTLHVVAEKDSYSITPSTSGGGQIDPWYSQYVKRGESKTYTIKPSMGYEIDDVLVDGISVGAVSTYTFSNVMADHTIKAIFKVSDTTIFRTITPSAGPNGSISPSRPVRMVDGTGYSFEFEPDAHYLMDTVLVDGVPVEWKTSSYGWHYTFDKVKADHAISVTFKPKPFYTISASASYGGLIDPSGSVSVESGNDAPYTYKFTPAVGYEIADVLVDGKSVGDGGTYNFGKVTKNHTIFVSFREKNATTRTITSSAGPNGSISPKGQTSVDKGGSKEFIITPDPGYVIADVLVDGRSVGEKANYTFTNVTSNHTISATFRPDTHTITPTAGANGSISPGGAVSVADGGRATFTITPNAGYVVEDVKVDGASVGAKTSHTFANVTENHTIEATFKPAPTVNHTITATAGPNGSISPSGAVSVPDGESQVFTITPNPGYVVEDIEVDGVSVGVKNSHIFTNVKANHTIEARFKEEPVVTHTITASANDDWGSITPSGAVSVADGESQTFAIIPNAGNEVEDVKVDGVSEGTVSSYTFSNVTANHTIEATFKKAGYTITASAGSNGSISPSGPVSVDDGGSQTFILTPNAGYVVDYVIVDGKVKRAEASYTFTDVTADHTIEARFKNSRTITTTTGPNGKIETSGIMINGKVVVEIGDNKLFRITPDPGYLVDDVLVDGVSEGAVSSYTFTNVTDDHTIHATFKAGPVTHTITPSAGSNGTISPGGPVSVPEGGEQKFNFKPNTGYVVENVKVDGVSVGTGIAYTFSNVTDDHTIEVTFKKSYTIIATEGPNGEIKTSGIMINGKVQVGSGDNKLFTIRPDPGYVVEDVLVDGSSEGAVSSYTFNNVTDNHTIHATFKARSVTYTIEATAGANGSISPDGAVSVLEGGEQRFTITPAGGYVVEDVKVDGVSVGAKTSYTFTNVTANHTIEATFKKASYTITASADPNGRIDPSGVVRVDHGKSQIFYFYCDRNDRVLTDVLVDGISVMDDVSAGAVSSYTFTNVTADHTIRATFKIVPVVTHTITPSAGSNGSISPNRLVTVPEGSNATFTIIPDAGYVVDDITVDGTSKGPDVSYTFTNIRANHTIHATFKTAPVVTHTITATAGSNGSISPSGLVSVPRGSSHTVIITPNSGYVIEDVKVNGRSVGEVSQYSLNNIMRDYAIHATFKKASYTITASAGSNGSISPNGAVGVAHGDSQTFTITPTVGYMVDDVKVDGSSVGAKTSHTFTDVTANHKIEATFKAAPVVTHTITPSAGSNGSISPSEPVSVAHGADATFTITPAVGYVVDDVLVDGVSVGAKTSHTFTNVTANHTISVTFKQTDTGSGGGETVTRYIITAGAESGGTISPNGKVSVSRNSNKRFDIVANSGYEVADVLVDGKSVGAVGSYTFERVTAHHTITATFRKAGGEATGTHEAYLLGYGNGMFGPDNSMTRGEAAQIFYNLLENKAVEINVIFSDVAADAWYAKAINTLGSMGIVVGMEDGSFAPESPITRAEFTAIATRFAKAGLSTADISFPDVPTGIWYYGAVQSAVGLGLISGYEDGTLRPDNTITRAEAAAIVNRMLKRATDKAWSDGFAEKLKQFADVTKDHWAYYIIVEAANSHNYGKDGDVERWTN